MIRPLASGRVDGIIMQHGQGACSSYLRGIRLEGWEN
jgi:hypothetical protein